MLRDGNRIFQRAGDEEDFSRAGPLVGVGRGGDGDRTVACARERGEGDPRRVASGRPRMSSRNGQRLVFAGGYEAKRGRADGECWGS